MKRGCTIASRQRGFALVAAIFLLVVIAALGAFAVRTTMSQQATADMALLSARAQAAVDAGIEFAAARLQAAPNCGNLSAAFPVADRFTVTFGPCQQQSPAPSVGGVTVNIFTVTVIATHSAYGLPDFVSRRATVQIVI